MTAEHPGAALRRAIEAGETIIAPGAFDSFSARLVQRAGFSAVYMTGLGATASRLGTPDLGLLTQTEMTEHARNMVRAVDIPVIADADTGYGGPTNIHRTVREYLQAGVAAIHLEDQVSPKRCGQLAGVRVMDAGESVLRLKAAIAARGSSEMLVIGRTDALGVEGVEEAVRRAGLYRDAGADLVFVDGVKKIADVERIARSVDGPKIISIVDGNETVTLTAKDLHEMGFSLVFFAVSTLFSAARAITQTLTLLKNEGSVAGQANDIIDYAGFSDIVDLKFFHDWAERYEP